MTHQATPLEYSKIPPAQLNTPIRTIERLRKALPGAPQLWIKRDDLTGDQVKSLAADRV